MTSTSAKTQTLAIGPSTTLSKVIRSYPEALDTLTKYGFLLETLEDARKARNMPAEPFQKMLAELGELAQPVKITPLARDKIMEIQKEEGKQGHGLRVRAVPGGMGGVQYEFAFEKSAAKDDTVIQNGDLKIFLDAMSINVMEGSKIDFVESEHGSGFKVDNPNAPAQSSGGGGGCGSGGCGCH